MNTGLKAIETHYNGYRFRSRLEARWAVFFDALGVKYDYEKEGFDLGSAGYYLPDFWLPKEEIWIEIKPELPDRAAMLKARLLVSSSGAPVVMTCGSFQDQSAYSDLSLFHCHSPLPLYTSLCVMAGGGLLGALYYPVSGFPAGVWCKKTLFAYPKFASPDSDKQLEHARIFAQGARFEHGERGQR